jgi:hypothetical protein
MSGGKWSEQLDEVREAFLDFAASSAESYAKWTHAGCGDCRRPGCGDCFPATSCRSEGDFLSDVVRLNLNYVSQLARMGSAYSFLATRVLDRFYDRYAPRAAYEPGASSCEPTAPCEVRLVGRAHLSTCLTVTNSLSTSGKFSIEGLKQGELKVKLTQIGAPTHTTEATLQFHLDGKPAPEVVPIDACNRARFVVELNARGLPAEKQYRGTIRATLGNRPSVIQLFVDVLP